MRILRSLLFYAVFYGGSTFIVIYCGVLLALGSTRRFAVGVDSWSRFHRWCRRRILGIVLEVEGGLPGGPVLVALKHESFLEAIELPQIIAQPVVFAKAELMRIPVWGIAARRYGLIEVHRDAGAKALRQMITAAKALTAEGRPLAIFPEGTRVPHGQRAPLQSGFAGLYKLLALPVVAVAVDSGPAYQPTWKRPGRVRIRFSAPIPPGLPREEIETRVLDAINAFNPPDAA